MYNSRMWRRDTRERPAMTQLQIFEHKAFFTVNNTLNKIYMLQIILFSRNIIIIILIRTIQSVRMLWTINAL